MAGWLEHRRTRVGRSLAAVVATSLAVPAVVVGARGDARPAAKGFASVSSAIDAGAIDPVTIDALRSRGHARVIVELGDNVSSAAFAAATVPGSSLARSDAPASARIDGARLRSVLTDAKRPIIAATASLTSLRRDYPNLAAFAVTVDSESDLLRLASTPGVARVDPDEQQHAFLDSSLPSIGQPTAVAAGLTGAGTYVAIIDTGVEYTRSAFGSCPSPGVPASCRVAEMPPDFTTQDDGVTPYDDHQIDDACDVLHGTNVSGIAAGTAPQTKLVVTDVFEWVDPTTGSAVAPCTSGAVSIAWTVDVLRAVDWLVGRKLAGVNIVAANLSLGGSARFTSACSDTHHFASLIAVGIQPVVAAGNAARDRNGGYLGDGVSRPACIAGAIPVGATDDLSNVAWFSQSGPFPNMLWAPGVDITAAGVANFSGTSMAAPHVAGAFAALSQVRPDRTLSERIDLLRLGATPIYGSVPSGGGARINLEGVIKYVIPPRNDDRARADDLPTNGTFYNHRSVFAWIATVEPGEAWHAGSPPSRTIWYRHTMERTGAFAVGNTISKVAMYGGKSVPCRVFTSGMSCAQVEALKGQVIEVVLSDPPVDSFWTPAWTHQFDFAEFASQGDEEMDAVTAWPMTPEPFNVAVDTTYTTTSDTDRFAPGVHGTRTKFFNIQRYLDVPYLVHYTPTASPTIPDLVVYDYAGPIRSRSRRGSYDLGPMTNMTLMVSSDAPAVGFLTVAPVPSTATNDEPMNPLELTGMSGAVHQGTTGAGPYFVDNNPMLHDRWYHLTAPTGGRLVLSTMDSNIDTAMCVTRLQTNVSTCVGDQVPLDAGGSVITLDVEAGESFLVQAGVPIGGAWEGMLELQWRYIATRNPTDSTPAVPSTTPSRPVAGAATRSSTPARTGAPDAGVHA